MNLLIPSSYGLICAMMRFCRAAIQYESEVHNRKPTTMRFIGKNNKHVKKAKRWNGWRDDVRTCSHIMAKRNYCESIYMLNGWKIALRVTLFGTRSIFPFCTNFDLLLLLYHVHSCLTSHLNVSHGIQELKSTTATKMSMTPNGDARRC